MSAIRHCDVCKQRLDEERIENDPKTRLCSTHAVEILQYGGEFKMTARQERTSKEGSLKLNYGAVETELVRNKEAIERLREDYLDRKHFS